MTYEDQFALQQRRNFLKFIGKAGVALPILQASSVGAGLMLARQVEAAGVVPRKIIFLHIPQGTPNKAGVSFTPSADLTLKICSKPLESVKSECVFIDKMDIEGGGGHGNIHRVLGGFSKAGGSETTIDIALAKTVGATSPVSSLLLGVRAVEIPDKGSISAFNANTPYYGFQDSPKAAFDRLFGGSVDASPIGNKRDKKIQEVNAAALAKLKTKLGNYELTRLQEHEYAMNKLKADIENAASAGSIAGCSSPAFNTQGLATGMTDLEFHDIYALQVENMLLAMRCNLTRVGVIQMGGIQGEFKVPGVANLPADIAHLHGSVHSNSIAYYQEYRTALSAKVAELITKLKNTDDGFGGKLIDTTLLVHVSDMSDGNAHFGDDAPFFLAGGGSAVKRGQVVYANNASHYRLLDMTAQYMGVGNAIKAYDTAAGAIGGILL